MTLIINSRRLVAQLIVSCMLVLAAVSPAVAMVRHVAFFVPPVPLAQFDDYYYNTHSRECIRYYGAWLRRYETYKAEAVPEEVNRLNVYRGRYTELWYDSVDAYREAAPNERAYTPAPWPGGGLSTREQPTVRLLVPGMPTNDFLKKSPLPSGGPYFRMLVAIRYPQGVSLEDGEKWYVTVHAEEAKQIPGLLRYVSYKVMPNSPMVTPWIRLTELWFKSYSDFKRGVLDTPRTYSAPPWAATGKPWLVSASTFVSDRPEQDFLKASLTR